MLYYTPWCLRSQSCPEGRVRAGVGVGADGLLGQPTASPTGHSELDSTSSVSQGEEWSPEGLPDSGTSGFESTAGGLCGHPTDLPDCVHALCQPVRSYPGCGAVANQGEQGRRAPSLHHRRGRLCLQETSPVSEQPGAGTARSPGESKSQLCTAFHITSVPRCSTVGMGEVDFGRQLMTCPVFRSWLLSLSLPPPPLFVVALRQPEVAPGRSQIQYVAMDELTFLILLSLGF